MRCEVCGLENGRLIKSRKFNMVLCRPHYMKGLRKGDPFAITKRTPNDIIVHDDYAEIVLRDNDCKVVDNTKVSLDKLSIAKKYKWYKSKSGYAVSFIGNKSIHLHREIVGNASYKEVDHINGDKLDNRNENLRLCTPSQNQWNKDKPKNNSSGVAGVYYSNSNKKWVAQITHKKKYYYLGQYDCMEEAIEARKNAENNFRKEYIRKEG